VRPRNEQDNALPSGGAAAAGVLLRLAAYTGEARYRDAAQAAVTRLRSLLIAHPTAFAHWLSALDFAAAPGVEVALVTAGDDLKTTGDPASTAAPEAADATLDAFLAVLSEGYRPHLVVAAGPAAPHATVPLLQHREPLDGRTTAYVCRAFACRQPVTDPAAFARQLTER